MGELSGFHTFSVSGLAVWEALKSVSRFVKSPHHIETPNAIGWGLGHCLLIDTQVAHVGIQTLLKFIELLLDFRQHARRLARCQ